MLVPGQVTPGQASLTDFLPSFQVGFIHVPQDGITKFNWEGDPVSMKIKRWVALPIAAAAAVAIGIAAVEAAPSPSPSPSASSKNYAKAFVDKLAAILHLTPTQTQDALKQAEKQTVDQMLADGQITTAQANAMKARIDAGQGLGPIGGFGLRPRGFFGGGRALMGSLKTAELNAVASALHMSTTDLTNALRSGKTLSDLEKQQNVTDSAVKNAVKSAAKGVLDPAVKAGTITQAQEDAILSRIDAGAFGLGHKRPGYEGSESESPSQSPNQSPSATPQTSPAAYYSTF